MERLRLTARFRAVRQGGRWVVGRYVAVGSLPNALTQARVGVRVKRGVRGAVARNRAKRLVREWCRQHGTILAAGQDVVIVLRQIEPIDPASLNDELNSLCQQLQPRVDLASGSP